MQLARSGLLSHIIVSVVVLAIGATRSLNAPPLFGASVTSGWRGLQPSVRWSQRPEFQSAEAWHEQVGLTPKPAKLDSPSSEATMYGKRDHPNSASSQNSE